jgi:hypothetical protein
MDVEKLIILVRSRREIYDTNLETDIWKYQMQLSSAAVPTV